MRRNNRGFYEDTDNSKAVLLLAGGILLVAIIAFFVVYAIYNNKVKSNELADIENESQKITISNSLNNSTAVSSSIGKNVNEVKNSMLKNNIITNEINNSVNNNVTNTSKVDIDKNTKDTENKNEIKNETINNNIVNENKIISEVKEEKFEPVFSKPVEEGEIYREYAKDNLVYSDTLEEWITHFGVDIKAPKTTVVVASEKGTVESIKNDPRYGLTVIIKHNSEYKTVYSNLLTAEFVTVGDEVEKGTTIGTVGSSAAFEIADEPHLHFEIIKNNEKVDPSLYIK